MAAPDGYGKGSIITPEAVVLDFELAGLASRSIAYAIDLIVQFSALMGMLSLISLVSLASPVAAIVFSLVGVMAVMLGYPVVMERSRNGQTLGRMAVNTRVVTVEGAPVRLRHSFIRALLGIIELLLTAGALAVVTSLLTKRGQRLGDLLAGTMIVRESSVSLNAGSIYFWPPPYLSEWSRTVDIRALGNDTYQLVREFLSSSDLADETHAALADDLALLVSERLPHAARPSTVPSIDYLTAIASATQQTAGQYPPPAPRRSAIQPPPPGGVRRPAPPAPGTVPGAAPLFRTPSVSQPPPPGARPPVTPTPPVSQPPVQPHGDPPQSPNDSGFAAPG